MCINIYIYIYICKGYRFPKEGEGIKDEIGFLKRCLVHDFNHRRRTGRHGTRQTLPPVAEVQALAVSSSASSHKGHRVIQTLLILRKAQILPHTPKNGQIAQC